MYSYSYDDVTGGIILSSTPSVFSKEPRPVYAPELDLLGFDKYWKYDKQSDIPYMWAESVQYYYRGKPVARLKGGNIYEAPEIILTTNADGIIEEPELGGGNLQPIDIANMVEKNREMIDILENDAVKRLIAIYEKYKSKLDIFHVAFSGGKDSAVLLELVKKALPQKSFVVIFGDTGMEFPDTYEAIRQTKAECEKDGTPFYISSSHLDPHESWKIFGPPARVLRWCCSVHKSTPQTLKLREITGKDDYIGMDFVGVRRHESVSRSNYQYENYGKKQRGQYSYNAILDWTSAEVWLYIFAKGIYVNEAYKKGNSRAGCLLCPMSGELSNYIRREDYTEQIDSYIEIIKNEYGNKDKKKARSYILNNGWSARKNGRELSIKAEKYTEKTIGDQLNIKVTHPATDWKEWIKTIGQLGVSETGYTITYKENIFGFLVNNNSDGYNVSISSSILIQKPTFSKYFKQVFRKSAYCTCCQVCETNCSHGCIKFVDGKVVIDGCIQCHQCHKIDSGCLLFHSIRQPQGGGKGMKSLNSFADHAPKPEWLQSFFTLRDDFFDNNTLGPMMYDMFRRFLKDAGLNEKNHFTSFAELIANIGWETETSMGLILTNLATENPQIRWYINNFELNQYYPRTIVEEMLVGLDVKPKDAKSIVKAYKRIVVTPLGTILNFGQVTDEFELVRTKCTITDNRVVLYALYKFAEQCNDYKEFTLTWLMNDNVERDGISPTRLFGLEGEEMKSILMGLTAHYPDFINATFTNDLDKISLTDKTATDVLSLFEEV